MYERLLKETERYLEHRKEIVVPVKQVWDAMIKQGRSSSFTVPTGMADFECLLEGDRRFEFVIEKNVVGAKSADGNDSFEHEEMEKLGFSDNQKVKLRRTPLPTSIPGTARWTRHRRTVSLRRSLSGRNSACPSPSQGRKSGRTADGRRP